MILKSIADVLNTYADSGLSLFDAAERNGYDDSEIRRKLRDLGILLLTKTKIIETDELMRATEELRRGV